jgi:hypothetical protein
MRRIRTMMVSAGAAALTTLAVVAAVPAIGDDGAAPQTADSLAACLRAHGLDGAPDGAALKPWLGQRLDGGDATAKRALDACEPDAVLVDHKAGPSEQQVRSCLKDHGIEVPGDDPVALKRWIGEHRNEAATAAALKACNIGPPLTKSAAGVCRTADPVTGAVPAKPDDKAATGQAPDTNRGASAGI